MVLNVSHCCLVGFLVVVVVVLLSTSAPTAHGKQLVVFAGPHNTGGIAVNKFFSTFAVDDGDSSTTTGLDGWIWPTVPENEEISSSPHHVFDLLIEQQDIEEVQTALLKAIRTAFEQSENGVIIGSLLFERIGENPSTGYDAAGVLANVVETLQIAPDDVLVAVTYRSPRIDQWSEVYESHFDLDSYDLFVCSDDATNDPKRWEYLDTCMNPFFVAQTYADEGYNVVVIDQQGVTAAGKDVAHVLACWFIDEDGCDDDWVIGLEDETIDLPPPAEVITELESSERLDLEQLFMFRDCYYITGVLDFAILYNVLDDCEMSLKLYYEQFTYTSFLMDLIQTQMECGSSDTNVPDLIAQRDDILAEAKNKRLVIVVGPHLTQADGVIKFFAEHASNETSSFSGWMWPNIGGDIEAGSANHLVFNPLVSDDDDDDVESAILNGIADSWHKSTRGLVMGSVLMGSVGSTPYSKFDGVAAVRTIVNLLSIDDSQVAIVVSYRRPRVSQWGVAWSEHFQATTYNEFICSDEQSDKRWEWLNSVMNPFEIAQNYFDEGFRVVVMDEEGIDDGGYDISHAIACEILEGVVCENGFVRGLSDATTEKSPQVEIGSLDEQEEADLEAMFMGRDCSYADTLYGNHMFHILNDLDVWAECSSAMADVYQQLSETDFLLNAMQKQEGCESFDVDIASLVGREDDTEDSTDTSNGQDDAEDSNGQDDAEDSNGQDDAEDSTETNGDNDDDSSNNQDDEDVSVQKKLIVFAGPHESGDVNQFFATYASPESDDWSDSFAGWIWPYVDITSLGHTRDPEKMFDILVRTEGAPEIQDVFLNAIKEGWESSEKGIVIGSWDFDKTGLNPASGYDPLGALQRVVRSIGVPNEDVTIVINYRAPRLEQWSAVWKNHFDNRTYEDFLCSDEEQLKLKRWEWLDTVMNPMKVANAYVEQGWNVATIDYYGSSYSGRDVAHVVACDIMQGVDCENGWVTDLEMVRVTEPASYSIDSLQYTEKNELEQAFQYRDCYYKFGLEENSRFLVLFQKKLWEYCPLEKERTYEELESTDLFLELLQSQQPCGSNSVDLNQYLASVSSSTSTGTSNSMVGLAVSVSILAVIVTVLAIYLRMRRTQKIRQKASDPATDGVFRDDPIVRVGPYRDDSDGQESDRPYDVTTSGMSPINPENLFSDLDLDDTKSRDSGFEV